MSKTMIISGFPGVGKTFCCENIKKIKAYDCDSSSYHYLKDSFGIHGPIKQDGSEWVKDYVDAIIKVQELGDAEKGHYDYIFISCHKEVRDELRRRGINYLIVAPKRELKNAYLIRYLKRGSHLSFIKSMSESWDIKLSSVDADPMPTIYLDYGEDISDILHANFQY